ncbi:metallophosphoesterase [Desulfobulbus rhabdoformis]|uniref:metallophosphoesterase n=1 Tax=Desulfobulbus rhabdoformis TaxID=34032 RepID=UPI001965A8F3|nr:metallophosphoesterase [Desulfobulbus rhabdoformis]MBM9616611.1 metallophosphoesterase [Desulfobulbus rhabdoformis]
MRLALPSLILVAYICISLIWWLPCRGWIKTVSSIVLVAISLKYLIYERIGGSFIAPDFPPFVLLSLEFLYSTLVILVFVLMLKDLILIGVLISRLWGSSWQLPYTPALRAGVYVCTALALAFYATWQSVRVPDVQTREISFAGLPKELDGFTIVQLSDLHIGLILKRAWLSEVVRKTNAVNADLVVLTGDMIDGQPDALEEEIAPLRELRAKHGVYGITGNHEYYFGAHAWIPVFERLGITMLSNDFRSFSVQGTPLILAGVPDSAARHFGEDGPDPVLFQKLPEGFHLLLQHRPAPISKESKIDLQLSGHTHGGHLFFLKWLIGSFNGNLVGGLYDFAGSKLYITPGTGVWAGFSTRLGVPAEITRIVLRHQS